MITLLRRYALVSDKQTTSVSHPDSSHNKVRKGNAATATAGMAHQFLMVLAKAGFWIGDLQAAIDEPIMRQLLPLIHQIFRILRQLSYLRQVTKPRPAPNYDDFKVRGGRGAYTGDGKYEQDDRYHEAWELWDKKEREMVIPRFLDIITPQRVLAEISAKVSAELIDAEQRFKAWLAENAKIQVIHHEEELRDGYGFSIGKVSYEYSLQHWHDFCISRLGHGYFSHEQEEMLFGNLVMTRYWGDINALAWHYPEMDGGNGKMSVYRNMGGVWQTKLKERVWELLVASDQKGHHFAFLLLSWPELILEQSADDRRAIIDNIAPVVEAETWAAMRREYLLRVIDATRIGDLEWIIRQMERLGKEKGEATYAD